MNRLHLTIIVVALLAMLIGGSRAATPPSGTLTPDQPQLSYTAGPFFVDNDTIQVSDPPICDTPATPCDTYVLHVSLPDDYLTNNPDRRIRIQILWENNANDFDLYVFDEEGRLAGRSDSSADPESVFLLPRPGDHDYLVEVVPFLVTGESFTGTISLYEAPPGPPPGSGIAPRYRIQPAPAGVGSGAGEPSIGVNWDSHNVMYQAGLRTLRVGFDDSTSPALASWEAVESLFTGVFSFDPIMYTDSLTGRTVVSQLVSAEGYPPGCSLTAFTDDDGENWTPSQGCGIPAGSDHQTLGGGPFAHIPGGTSPLDLAHPGAVYYCAQELVTAFCSLSIDGGLTFGDGVPIYTLVDCGGLHGHVKVGPEGVVYVPNKGCGPHQAVVVSEDNGTTWHVRQVPTSSPGTSDPSVGIGASGRVYFGYGASDGHAHVAVSYDHGVHWLNDIDVGAQQGIQNMVFPAVVAGDDDRAAFAFLGTRTPGNFQGPDFDGEWHLYVASTFDGGQTWITADATPKDPVQRGCIWLQGGSNPCRNLLDFMGATVDAVGRVLVGFADGCRGPCVNGEVVTHEAKATIARQSGGRRMFAAFDPVEPALPKGPRLDSALRDKVTGRVTLDWSAPDNGGEPIEHYRIYRGTASGDESLLTTIGTKTGYADDTAPVSGPVYYRISAVNSVGDGELGNELATSPAPPPQDKCHTPGARVVTDPSGDETGDPADPALDIQAVSVAEPFLADGTRKLIFTLKVADLGTVPPNSQWVTLFTEDDGITYFVNMNTGSNPAQPQFEYGHLESTAAGTTFTTDGPADAGSGFSSDGTITIIVGNAKVGSPAAGDLLTDVNAETQILIGAGGTGLLETVDQTDSGSYTLVGNASCPVQ